MVRVEPGELVLGRAARRTRFVCAQPRLVALHSVTRRCGVAGARRSVVGLGLWIPALALAGPFVPLRLCPTGGVPLMLLAAPLIVRVPRGFCFRCPALIRAISDGAAWGRGA